MFRIQYTTCKARIATVKSPTLSRKSWIHSVQFPKNAFNVAPALYGAQRRRATANAIEAPDLPSISTSEADAEWISSVISFWLDEEWGPMEVHQQLGKAAGDAYVACRQDEVQDYGDLCLGLAAGLESFPNYRDTFTNNFEIGNKVVEILMLRGGADVCSCGSDADEMLKRHSESFASQ